MTTLTDLINPAAWWSIILSANSANTLSIGLIVRIIVLLLLGMYLVMALTAYVKMGRLEQWLLTLQKYKFRRYLLIHLIATCIGWVIAFIIL